MFLSVASFGCFFLLFLQGFCHWLFFCLHFPIFTPILPNDKNACEDITRSSHESTRILPRILLTILPRILLRIAEQRAKEGLRNIGGRFWSLGFFLSDDLSQYFFQ